MVPEKRHYYPDGMARRAGSQIPAGAEIAVEVPPEEARDYRV